MAAASEPLRMRATLGPGIPAPSWPPGVTVIGYDGAWAERLHALLEHGYRNGFGEVAPYPAWRPRLEGDEEFDPALVFLATAGDALAGAAICWTSSFVKDIVVHEDWRGRGLGGALLLAAFAELHARGAAVVELKVDPANASAIRVYERLGMQVVAI